MMDDATLITIWVLQQVRAAVLFVDQNRELIVLWAVHLAACLGVVAAVICRVDEMNRNRNKLSWFAMYLAYAVFALVVLGDVLQTGEWNGAYLAGLLAVGLNLAVTLPHWRHGAPASSCRPRCDP
jgi:hypothetical protein